MTKLALILAASLALPARAEINLGNVFNQAWAYFGGGYYRQRSWAYPIVRPRRIPLIDLAPCATDECALLNGRKVALEPTPASVLHGRVQIVGQSKQKKYVAVYARARFGSWVNADPDVLHVWAMVRNRDRRVKILGYSLRREDQPGTENESLTSLRDFSLYKFLTSQNPLEVEIARELINRRVFCVKYPADPNDSIRDDVAPLEARKLIGSEAAQLRLSELNAVAAVIDPEGGSSKCETSMADQVDNVLDQIRRAIEAHVNPPRVRAQVKSMPAPTPKAEPPKPEEPKREEPKPAPGPQPSSSNIPFL